MLSRLALAFVALSAAATCARRHGVCTANTDCQGGQACLDGACRTLCRADNECPASERCEVDHCVDRGATDGEAPIIAAVNGTGSTDQVSGHTARHLRDRLVITGYNLAAATATLLPETGAPYDLAPCVTPTDSELQVRLPPQVPAGRYSLVVANQAGVCDASLQLLQGEPGSLSASGALIVDSINGALGADQQLRLRGALPIGESVSFVAATAAVTLGGSSIVVNDREEIGAGENGSAGFYLVIIDLATHQVVDQSAGAGMTSKGPFLANEATKLHDVLVWADTRPELVDYAVTLVSTGDVSTMAAADGNADPNDPNDQLWVELQKLGATPRVRTLAATDAYVLVGQKGVGEGNGLERVGGSARAGVAGVGATLVGGLVQGITSATGVPFARGALRAMPAAVKVTGTLDVAGTVDVTGTVGVTGPLTATGRATAGGYDTHGAVFYVMAGGCLAGDVEAGYYRTEGRVCAGSTDDCFCGQNNSCTIPAQGWGTTKPSGSCGYKTCVMGIFCGTANATCSVPVWYVCNPTLQ
ncbi:MAG: hypothetical protein HY903_18630 [Deltaproteobacteria bacterium]|nr:hypothetical protein [Deltaproteobacteria bacterium]